jgi:hypothetical protein
MMREAGRKRLEAIKMRLHYPVAKPQGTAAVLEASRYFGVNMADQQERDLLLAALAEFAFGKGKVGRRPGSKAWTDLKLGKLYDAIVRHTRFEVTEDGIFSAPRFSDGELAKEIAKEFAAHQKSGAKNPFQSAEAIRRHLPAARDWYDKWFAEVEPPDDWEPPEPDWDDQDD